MLLPHALPARVVPSSSWYCHSPLPLAPQSSPGHPKHRTCPCPSSTAPASPRPVLLRRHSAMVWAKPNAPSPLDTLSTRCGISIYTPTNPVGCLPACLPLPLLPRKPAACRLTPPALPVRVHHDIRTTIIAAADPSPSGMSPPCSAGHPQRDIRVRRLQDRRLSSHSRRGWGLRHGNLHVRAPLPPPAPPPQHTHMPCSTGAALTA